MTDRLSQEEILKRFETRRDIEAALKGAEFFDPNKPQKRNTYWLEVACVATMIVGFASITVLVWVKIVESLGGQ